MEKFLTGKQVKDFLFESVGVPDNIVETSEDMINKIITFLNSDKNVYGETEIDFKIIGNFSISDFQFPSMLIRIIVNRTSKYDSLVFDKAASDVLTNKVKDKFQINQVKYSPDNNMIVLVFETQTSYNITYGNISKLIGNNKNYFITVLSHELKHQFDGIKKPINPILNKADYTSYANNIGKSITPIDDFVRGLYYTYDFENLVRNSELYSEIKMDNIKKADFKNFLESSDVYKSLLKYKYLTIDDIIADIKKNYMIDVSQKLSDISGIESMSDDEKINEIFKILYIGIRDSKLQYLKNYLSDTVNGIKKLINKNEEFYNNELKKLDSQDIMPFFRNKQLEMNKNADLTLKKVSKLYSMLTEVRYIRERTY